MGTPSNLTTGPGTLHVANHGATLPTARATALGTGWYTPGYTEEGYTFSMERTMAGMYVAETRRPVKQFTTEEKESVVFAMAEATNLNLILALNQGVTDTAAVGYDPEDPITPTDLDAEVRVSIVFDADNGARWVFAKCINMGTTEVARKKAPDKALIPVEFMLEQPDTGQPWTIYPNAAGLI